MPPPMPGITNQPMTIGGQGQPPAVVPQPGQTAGQQGQQQPPPQQQPRPQPTPTPPYQGGTYGNPQPLVQGQFTQSAAPAGPQAAPKKRPKNILVITDPDTGANVLDGLLKGKDEGKAAETVSATATLNLKGFTINIDIFSNRQRKKTSLRQLQTVQRKTLLPSM